VERHVPSRKLLTFNIIVFTPSSNFVLGVFFLPSLKILCMKNILTCLMLLVPFSIVFSQQSIQVEGEVSGTWDVDTVYVVGNLVVPESQKLTILSGSVIQFNGFYSVDIRGSILAQGSEGDSIKFTVADTTGFYNFDLKEGCWNRITLANQSEDSDSTIFEYCRFEYSKTDTFQLHGGAFYIEKSSKIRISNSVFSHLRSFENGGAIYLNSSRAIIRQNIFEHIVAGTKEHWGYGGAICGVSSQPEISRNIFRNNKSTGIGGACSFEFEIPILYANKFENNFSALGGALGFLRATTGGVVSNNICANNSSTFFGGAIAMVAASPVLVNNTLVNNSTIYGGGIYCNDGSSPKIYNTVLWGNVAAAGYGMQVFIIDGVSQPEFYNSVFEHGASDFSGSGFTGVYSNCLESDPLFSNSPETPFALTEDSPCIDSGLTEITNFQLPLYDLLGLPRVSNGNVDVGAYEFQWPNQVLVSENITHIPLSIHYSSNSGNLHLFIKLPSSNDVTVEFFDIRGSMVHKQNFENCAAGEIELRIQNFKQKGSGLYICRLVSSGKVSTQKFEIF